MARGFLQQEGYRILQSNYRCSYGEIDIIAQDGEETVFVEVKTRRNSAFGSPEESLTPRKCHHLIASSEEYLERHARSEDNYRIDLISIRLQPDTRSPRIEHLRHAVQV